MTIYPYIHEAIESIIRYFENNPTGNPLVAMPTGTGKSLVIGLFCKMVIEQYPRVRMLVLTHQKELIMQNYEEHKTVWPHSPCGIYAASLGKRESLNPITFGSIQTLYRAWQELGVINLILIDEAHLVSPKNETMYQWLIKGMQQINPNLRIIGLSATCWRLGHGMLTDNHIFSDICYDLTTLQKFNWLIDEGYLCPLRPVRTEMFYNLQGIPIVAGDYNQQHLQERLDTRDNNVRILNEIVRIAADRYHWLIFATSIEHCEHIVSLLNSDYGISAVAVHSKQSKELRDANFLSFKKGRVRCLVNKDLATTGFNFRPLDFIAVMRATMSSSLWVQMLGRGTRPSPGKTDCLVADFARNTERLGPINDPVLPRPPKDRARGPQVPPIKICPTCNTYLHTSTRLCDNCGHEFKVADHLTDKASELELIKRFSKPEPKIIRCYVKQITFSRYAKRGKPASMRVTYYCNQGVTVFHQYLGFEHVPFVKRKATHWWRELSRGQTAPETVNQALSFTQILRPIIYIEVDTADKYPEIVSIEYKAEDGSLNKFYCDPDHVHSN